MRKALFALVLVAASFAGGAVVNGPGLVWIKDAIGLIDVETPPENPAIPNKPSDHPREVPSVRPTVNFDRPAPSAKPAPPEYSPRSDSTMPIAIAELEPLEKTPTDTSTVVDDKPKRDDALAPAVDSGSRISANAESGPPERLPIIPRNSIKDWSELRRRLKEAGLTRFETEAELDGRCRFRGFVPLAGKNAVCRIFEAEGDDEFQAAEAALRRMILWQASEKTDP